MELDTWMALVAAEDELLLGSTEELLLGSSELLDSTLLDE